MVLEKKLGLLLSEIVSVESNTYEPLFMNYLTPHTENDENRTMSGTRCYGPRGHVVDDM